MSKADYGDFKSLMAQIMAEELGNGRFKKTHLQLWDNFLTSIGIEPQIFSDSLHPENFNLLAELKQLTLNKPIGYVIGLCGMGGECLCQIYLTAMYKYITLNPYIQSNKETIDWEFWNIHIGEEDIRHRVMVKNAINEIIQAEPSHLPDLAAGYQKAKSNWDEFWGNNYKLAERVKLTAVQ
nr:iron-containing redox enzyme family protein [Nostoc sphaeroides]